MKNVIVFLLLICSLPVAAQQTFGFESDVVPSQWTAEGGAVLSVDTRHFKGGGRALKCELRAGSLVRMNLNTQTSNNRVVFVPVYSEKVSNDTLVFRHYDANGILRQEGRMLLNFRGWRLYQRHLYYDFGGKAWSGYKQLKIAYATAAGESAVRTIWIDDVVADAVYTGNNMYRTPGPHDLPDYLAGNFVGDYVETDYLKAGLNTPGAAPQATQQELADYEKVKQAFSFGESYINSSSSAADARPYLSQSKCEEAKTYVKGLNLAYNEDGSIRGTGFSFPFDPNDLLSHSLRVLALSYGAQTLQDAEAETLLTDYVRHLVDQGIAAGSAVRIPTNTYSVARQFLLGFLHALPLLRDKDGQLAAEVENLLRYAYLYNQVFGRYEPGLSTDYIHIHAKYLFALADLRTTADEKARDIHAIKTLYENFTTPTLGELDGIKPDGIGYHHRSMHNAYMYAFGTWVGDVSALQGTVFRVSDEALRNVGAFYVSHLLQTANDGNTAFYANTSCGRAPFSLSAKVTKSNFNTLVQMGKSDGGDAYDDLLRSYNYLYSVSSSDKKDMDGFHAFNYGALGVYRANGWTATAAGLTSRIWGTEIYDKANVFGRYQSYGSLEVMYNGANVLARSGYPLSTSTPWDWNVVPGATTVHRDWKNLAPNATRADEYQEKSFAGSLSAGKEGIFALDFTEKPTYYAANGLNFKKTVIAFDGMLLCLGSDITASNASERTATNLFQTILSTSTGSLYVDSPVAAGQSYEASLASGADRWIVNPSGTGYFIPSGNDAVAVFQGGQSSPMQNNAYNAGTFTMATTNAAKAWIDHGTNPFNRKYHFVVLPGATAATMQELSPGLQSGAGIYTILGQQSNGHIVRLNKLNKMAYAVFSPYYNIPEGIVKDIQTPCLLMADESEAGYLTLHVVKPDLTDADTSFEITLRGTWKLESASIEDVGEASLPAQQTALSAMLPKGMKAEIRLRDTAFSSLATESAPALAVYYDADFRLLKIENPAGLSLETVQLLDISGRKIGEWRFSGEEPVSLSHISSGGIYLVRIGLSDGRTVTKKIRV